MERRLCFAYACEAESSKQTNMSNHGWSKYHVYSQFYHVSTFGSRERRRGVEEQEENEVDEEDNKELNAGD